MMPDGWGWWWQQDSIADTIPADARCWKCEHRRMHDWDTDEECLVGLCRECCDELKAGAA